MKVALNTPNLLTFSRLILTGVILFLCFEVGFFENEVVRVAVVVVLYIIAALTDYYDGHFARKLKERTEFGSFMDSLIDKIFTLSMFYAMVYVSGIFLYGWLIHLILIREVGITVLRVVKIWAKTPMVTERHGKVKTTIQIVAQSFLLAYLLVFASIYHTDMFNEFYLKNNSWVFIWDIPWNVFMSFFVTELGVPEGVMMFFKWLPNILVGVVVVFTLYSGISYLNKNRVSQIVE